MTEKQSLADLSLVEAADAIGSGQLSPVELTEACLERIRLTEPTLCSFISVFESEARESAAEAYAEIRAGRRRGPLHGIPVAVKDNIALRGFPTTAGSKILKDWVPQKDATVVERLRQAGAVFVGKTNMHEFAWGGTSANPHYGTVRNPWNPERFAAGSSGGSGTAVAAGCCLMALGTDTGGSIRLPSSVSGVCGIRPTIGRVSNAGVVPLAWSMDTVGPMARSAEDCALALNVIGGPDGVDPGVAPVRMDDMTASLADGVGGMRIGIVPHFFSHLQPDVDRAVRQALTTLQGLGAELRDVEIAHIEGNISAQLTIESCEPSAYHQEWLRTRPEDYGDDVRALLELGELQLATNYLQAQRYRSLLRSEFLRAFNDVDVFICPTLPFTATPVGATTVVIEDGLAEDMLSAIMQHTGVPSLVGLPSLSIPSGFSDGLPIGMQIIGKPFCEATVFCAGHAFQSATEFHRQRPTLDWVGRQ